MIIDSSPSPKIPKSHNSTLSPFSNNDKATFEKPHQYAVGMKHVFVNGTQVLNNGIHTGAMPGKIPALYTMMNHADLSLGTWYPEGGMHALANALEQIALESGVTFNFNSPVSAIEAANGKVKGIRIGDKLHEFDTVISGADYHHTEQELLPKENIKYNSKYWDSRKLAPSSLIFYLGIDRKVKNLHHHNLFFDEDLSDHGKEIYINPKWPKKPLFYVCAPSKTDSNVAPDGKENLFILMPIATDLDDNDETRENYLKIILDRIKTQTGEVIEGDIIYKRSFCVSEFKSEYNSFKGNAYGLANTLMQTANLKPTIKSNLKNMFFCGVQVELVILYTFYSQY